MSKKNIIITVLLGLLLLTSGLLIYVVVRDKPDKLNTEAKTKEGYHVYEVVAPFGAKFYVDNKEIKPLGIIERGGVDLPSRYTQQKNIHHKVEIKNEIKALEVRLQGAKKENIVLINPTQGNWVEVSKFEVNKTLVNELMPSIVKYLEVVYKIKSHEDDYFDFMTKELFVNGIKPGTIIIEELPKNTIINPSVLNTTLDDINHLSIKVRTYKPIQSWDEVDKLEIEFEKINGKWIIVDIQKSTNRD